MIIFDTRDEMLTQCAKGGTICEIGVFRGDFSRVLLNNTLPSELHLIDIFSGKLGSGDKDGNNMIYTDLNDEYERLKKLYSNDTRVKIHRGYSYEVLNSFGDEYFDMIYIDGDHSYDGVKKDLALAVLKVKNGGLIAGHDYNIAEFPGVVRAVGEFVQYHQLSIDYMTRDGLPSFGIINRR